MFMKCTEMLKERAKDEFFEGVLLCKFSLSFRKRRRQTSGKTMEGVDENRGHC